MAKKKTKIRKKPRRKYKKKEKVYKNLAVYDSSKKVIESAPNRYRVERKKWASQDGRPTPYSFQGELSPQEKTKKKKQFEKWKKDLSKLPPEQIEKRREEMKEGFRTFRKKLIKKLEKMSPPKITLPSGKMRSRTVFKQPKRRTILDF